MAWVWGAGTGRGQGGGMGDGGQAGDRGGSAGDREEHGRTERGAGDRTGLCVGDRAGAQGVWNGAGTLEAGGQHGAGRSRRTRMARAVPGRGDTVRERTGPGT